MNRNSHEDLLARSIRNRVGKRFDLSGGFTLLEVMIAIAIIAIAFTSLFGSQSTSLSLAIEARFNSTAAFLAQEKEAEYRSGTVPLSDDEGDFGDDFPGFRWRTEVRDGTFEEVALLNEIEQPLQRLELTISWQEDQFTATFTSYFRGEAQ